MPPISIRVSTPSSPSRRTEVGPGRFVCQCHHRDEVLYQVESHGNYNQGFSYGDGYNALGYYQFDRRWSLIPFMKQAYNYNPEKYSMLKDAIDRGSEISNASNAMSENGQLTELGRIAQEAFQGAYNTDPAEFSALQDAYAYNFVLCGDRGVAQERLGH